MTPGRVELDTKIVQVSAGDSHTAMITRDGALLVCGNFKVRGLMVTSTIAYGDLLLTSMVHSFNDNLCTVQCYEEVLHRVKCYSSSSSSCSNSSFFLLDRIRMAQLGCCPVVPRWTHLEHYCQARWCVLLQVQTTLQLLWKMAAC